VGDAFIISDADSRKIYRKPENNEEFTLNFTRLIHQIVSGGLKKQIK